MRRATSSPPRRRPSTRSSPPRPADVRIGLVAFAGDRRRGHRAHHRPRRRREPLSTASSYARAPASTTPSPQGVELVGDRGVALAPGPVRRRRHQQRRPPSTCVEQGRAGRRRRRRRRLAGRTPSNADDHVGLADEHRRPGHPGRAGRTRGRLLRAGRRAGPAAARHLRPPRGRRRRGQPRRHASTPAARPTPTPPSSRSAAATSRPDIVDVRQVARRHARACSLGAARPGPRACRRSSPSSSVGPQQVVGDRRLDAYFGERQVAASGEVASSGADLKGSAVALADKVVTATSRPGSPSGWPAPGRR